MLTYTFNDMSATKYAKSTVNVRNLPDTDGEKVGSLSLNREVTVTGQCNETGWYRIEFDGNTAYVSDSYLVDNKIETQTESTAGTTASDNSSSSQASSSLSLPTYTSYADVKAYAISLGYPIGTATDNGDGTANDYSIDCVQPGNYLCWDHEYEASLADLQAARLAAEAITGHSMSTLETIVGKVKIANGNDGHYWEVVVGKVK